ncbi:MFS transporter [Halarchaeum grantii]|uniref:MFS transporter n=1 Tax=Halarchaeum grantii TaxID=1193105 RepID=UPI0016657DF9|nr:MFS transporter [Halarchaeum grantii]
MSARRRWTAAVFGFTVGDALALQVRGALVPSLQRAFDVDPALLGLVAPAGTVGFLCTVLLAGAAAGRLDVRRTVLAALAVASVALLAMSAAPAYGVFLAFLFVQGSADGVVRGLDRPVLAHFYPEQRGRIFNVYGLVWAVGAAAAPLVVVAVLAVGNWRWVFAVLSVAFVPAAVLVARAGPPSIETGERALSRERLAALLRDRRILGVLLALVCSGGIEGCLFTWLPYYASGFLPEAYANVLLSAYLVAYVPGRALYGAIVGRVDPLALVAVLGAVTAPALYVAFTASGTVAVVAAVLVVGLCVCGLYPTLSAFGVNVAPAYSGPVNALTTGANYLGLSLAPAAVGVLASATSVGTALSSLVAPAVGVVAVALALRTRSGTATAA